MQRSDVVRLEGRIDGQIHSYFGSVYAMMEGVHDSWKELPVQTAPVSTVDGYWNPFLWVEDAKVGWKENSYI